MLRNNNTAADACGIGVCEAEQVLDVFLELREDGAGIQLLNEGHEHTADDNDNNGDDDDIEERTFTALIGQTVGNLCEKLLHRDTFLRGLPAIKIDEMCMYGTSPEDVTPLPTAHRVEDCRQREKCFSQVQYPVWGKNHTGAILRYAIIQKPARDQLIVTPLPTPAV